MAGLVVSVDESTCRGWAKINSMPFYAVLVNLISGGNVVATGVADGRPPAGEAEDHHCWFSLRVPDNLRLDACYVMIGETREIVDIRHPFEGFATDMAAAADRSQDVFTYLDALRIGLTNVDIVEMFYIDILRRPADFLGLEVQSKAIASGQYSLESIRRSFIASEEAAKLRLSAREAPGCIFSKDVAWRSSSRRRGMENEADAFVRSPLPLADRLLDFLPGLVATPEIFAGLVTLAARGVPEREIFFRALGAFSTRPSLIGPGRPPLARPTRSEDSDDSFVTILCDSHYFAAGWHQVEGGAPSCRWMEQVGVLLNPRPDAAMEKVEISICNWIGQDRTIWLVADGIGLSTTIKQDAGELILVAERPDGQAFSGARLSLVAGEADCPWRLNGSPDPRLLSCCIEYARISYQGHPR